METVEAVAGTGAACACLVRALATRPGEGVPVGDRLACTAAAWQQGATVGAVSAVGWPQPSLDG